MTNSELGFIARDIETVARAILRGDNNVTLNNQEFTLPKGQTAGTETQKLMYARLKAKEVLSV